uniref:Ig-like domain-containing protein n=1 Tax=Buteo japonicus TaxID=224669 RepID=A0A8C0AXP5_9AVES
RSLQRSQCGIVCHPTGSCSLTQPPSVSANPGQTVQITCSGGSSSSGYGCVGWHQQKTCGPVTVVYANDYRPSDIPSQFSGSTSGSTSTLTITGVQAEDEAVYYCGGYDGSSNGVWPVMSLCSPCLMVVNTLALPLLACAAGVCASSASSLDQSSAFKPWRGLLCRAARGARGLLQRRLCLPSAGPLGSCSACAGAPQHLWPPGQSLALGNASPWPQDSEGLPSTLTPSPSDVGTFHLGT